MTGWEQALGEWFDDFETHAESVFATERAHEVVDRAESEFASVDLAGRLLATDSDVGGTGSEHAGEVTLHVHGPGRVAGRLVRVTQTWCLVEGAGQEWIVPVAAVLMAEGLPERAVPPQARRVTARLGLGSALRRLAGTGIECRIWLRDGTTRDGRLGRAGADFVELHAPLADGGSRRTPGPPTLVPWSALGAVQSRPGF